MTYVGSEIITLQFGHYSNFIGTHWWNSQEAGFEYDPDTPSEINHDVLFREGQTQNGAVTYTPRLLLVDLKGALSSLSERGKLYEEPPDPDPTLPLWPVDRVSVKTQPSESKNEFLTDLEQGETSAATLPSGLKEKGVAVPKLYHLDDSVKTWSDFLRPHLHPRSFNIVQEYQHNEACHPFDTFTQGQALWASPRFNEHFGDRIRLYLEETDNLQGFQVIMDSFDGFSGFGSSSIQSLRDEYPSKSVFCVVSQPPCMTQSPKEASTRVLNQALALSSLAELSCMFTPVSGSVDAWQNMGLPVSFPHLSYKPELYYHSSAVVAAALESVSILYRLRSSSERLSDLTSRLSLYGRQAVSLSVMLPFPLQADGMLLDSLESWEGPLTHSLTPLLQQKTTCWMQSFVLRGIPESRLMKADQRDMSSPNPAYTCRTLAELLKTYLKFTEQTTGITHVITADSAFKTSAPFPHLFNKNISSEGYVDVKSRPSHVGVNQVPVLAGLHSNSGLGPLLESLHGEAKRINIRSLHQFAESGLESTELLESLENLLCLSECYSEHHMDL